MGDGVRREWFQLLAAELTHPDTGAVWAPHDALNKRKPSPIDCVDAGCIWVMHAAVTRRAGSELLHRQGDGVPDAVDIRTELPVPTSPIMHRLCRPV